jgi:hypothetical protein
LCVHQGIQDRNLSLVPLYGNQNIQGIGNIPAGDGRFPGTVNTGIHFQSVSVTGIKGSFKHPNMWYSPGHKNA